LLGCTSNEHRVFQAHVCSFSHQARMAHAPYCHLWRVWLRAIFFTLAHKRHYFLEKVTEHKMSVLILFATFLTPGRISDIQTYCSRSFSTVGH